MSQPRADPVYLVGLDTAVRFATSEVEAHAAVDVVVGLDKEALAGPIVGFDELRAGCERVAGGASANHRNGEGSGATLQRWWERSGRALQQVGWAAAQ